MVEDIPNSLYSFNNENNASLDKLYVQLQVEMIEKNSHGRLKLLMKANTFRMVLNVFPKCVRLFLVYIYIYICFTISMKLQKFSSTDIKIILFSIYIETENNLRKKKFPLRC